MNPACREPTAMYNRLHRTYVRSRLLKVIAPKCFLMSVKRLPVLCFSPRPRVPPSPNSKRGNEQETELISGRSDILPSAFTVFILPRKSSPALCQPSTRYARSRLRRGHCSLLQYSVLLSSSSTEPRNVQSKLPEVLPQKPL